MLQSGSRVRGLEFLVCPRLALPKNIPKRQRTEQDILKSLQALFSDQFVRVLASLHKSKLERPANLQSRQNPVYRSIRSANSSLIRVKAYYRLRREPPQRVNLFLC